MADLTTTAKVKSYLGISSSTFDALIAEMVTNYSALVEDLCNRVFNSATFTEYFDTHRGESKIFLKNYPVTSITSNQYRSGTVGSITWSDFNVNDYLLNDNGKISYMSCLPESEKYIKVVYVGGYATLPAGLVQIVTELVAGKFNVRNSDGILSETTEGQSVTYKDDGTIESKYLKRLSPYRSIKV